MSCIFSVSKNVYIRNASVHLVVFAVALFVQIPRNVQ